MKYDVEQTLVRRRTIQVDARSKEEALERAQAGHGEVVANERRYKLLAAKARRSVS